MLNSNRKISIIAHNRAILFFADIDEADFALDDE
jgi:hypothetical protein